MGKTRAKKKRFEGRWREERKDDKSQGHKKKVKEKNIGKCQLGREGIRLIKKNEKDE